MNGKKSKMLRREAEQRTIGQDATYYEPVNPGSTNSTPTMALIHSCTRAVYKRLKRDYRAGLAL